MNEQDKQALPESGLGAVPTEELYRELIYRFDRDPSRDGLLRTPERAAKAMQFLTSGLDQDPGAILRSALFEVDYDEMVIVRDIEMYSLCEHHMLPFFGQACTSPTFLAGKRHWSEQAAAPG